MKTYEWSKPGETPPHEGVWQTAYPEGLAEPVRVFNYWNGSAYGKTCYSVDEADAYRDSALLFFREFLCFRTPQSDWSEPGEKPPRVGVWKIKLRDSRTEYYMHWNGSWWGYCADTPYLAGGKVARSNRTGVDPAGVCFCGLLHPSEEQE
jgi:hypothetical protein